MTFESLLRLGAFFVGIAATAGCSTLEVIPSSICGNGVVEGDSEDCDPGQTAGNACPNPTVSTPSRPFACAPPGSLAACRFCRNDKGECPRAMTYAASLEACVRSTGGFSNGATRIADGIPTTNITLADSDGNGSLETVATYNLYDASRYFFEAPSSRDFSNIRPHRLPEWPVPPLRTRTVDGVTPGARDSARSVLAPFTNGVTMLHRASTEQTQPDARFGNLDLDDELPRSAIVGDHNIVSLRRTFARKGSVRDGLAAIVKTAQSLDAVMFWAPPDAADGAIVDHTSADPEATVDATACGAMLKSRKSLTVPADSEVVFTGRADVVRASPCDEFVIAFRDGSVRIVESCDVNGCALPSNAVNVRSVSLVAPPSGIKLLEVAVADVNSDGTIDIVSAWSTGAIDTAPLRAKTFSIALGSGTGSFDAPIPFTVNVVNNPESPLTENLSGLTVFRERRDDNGAEAGRTFAVIADRVIRFDGDLFPPQPGAVAVLDAVQVTWPTGALRWENPIDEDLDADGVVDVVLRSGPHLYVLRGNDFGAFGISLLDAGTNIRSFTLGDFDRDNLVDIAVTHEQYTTASGPAPTSTTSVAVEVAYGQGSARFGAWLPLLGLKNVDARLLVRREPHFNGSDALFVVAPSQDAGSPEIMALVGDGTQGGLFPTSRVSCESGPKNVLLRGGTVARHEHAGVKTDVLLLVSGRPLSSSSSVAVTDEVLVLTDGAKGAAGLRKASCAKDTGVGRLASVAAANLCSDASDEVLGLGLDGENIVAGIFAFPDGPLDLNAPVAFSTMNIGTTSDRSDLAAARLRMIPADLDADGATDVLIRVRNRVYVLWNNSNKSPAGCAASNFTLATVALSLEDADTVKGVALLPQGAQEPAHVMLLTGAGIVEFQLDRQRGVTRIAPADPADSLYKGAKDATALEIGDVDGDGFDDIVIGDGLGIRIHYGIERRRSEP